MKCIYPDLVQFSAYVQPIDIAFNQYLLDCGKPVLIHTGSADMAKSLIAPLKEALGGKSLSHIFVSHFESDECGGLELILREHPGARVICSEVTARQLLGFGIKTDALPKKGGDVMSGPDYELAFLTYPSEMHLWDGLLLLERRRKILFSSDLMFRPGEAAGMVIERDILSEIDAITPMQIPGAEKRLQLIAELKREDVSFIATGHGPCVKGVKNDYRNL